MKVNFTLNGNRTELETAADRRVVDVIREELGLTGTKECCGSGECGACGVLVDGENRLSCLMLAPQLMDRDIVTVEGLSTTEEPNRLQEAFAVHGAIQCGFCTPGMLMAATDLLNKNPQPSRREIREGISGNLCRCTGYQKIVDAIESASKQRTE